VKSIPPGGPHHFKGGMRLKMEGMHVIHFFWKDLSPHLILHPVVADGLSLSHPKPSLIQVHRLSLGEVWNYTVLPGRWCVGRLEEESYLPCPEGRVLKEFHICPRCRASLGKPTLREIFEPEEGCEGEICEKPHVVYLAFYGEKMKVGMTPEERLLKRAVEQGADAVGVLLHLENRREARAEEKRISKELRVPQALPAREILAGMSRGFKREVIEERYRRVLEAVGGEEELTILRGYPLERLSSAPSPWKGKRIHGRVLGAKGRYIIVQMGGPKAINTGKLLGRVLVEGSTKPSLEEF